MENTATVVSVIFAFGLSFLRRVCAVIGYILFFCRLVSNRTKRNPLLPVNAPMHYLDPNAILAVTPGVGVDAADSVTVCAKAEKQAGAAHGPRELTGILGIYENYMRAGGQASLSTWLTKRYAGYNTPDVTLPRAVYTKRARQSSAPIRQLLASTTPALKSDIAAVEHVMRVLEAFEADMKNHKDMVHQQTGAVSHPPQLLPATPYHDAHVHSVEPEVSADTKMVLVAAPSSPTPMKMDITEPPMACAVLTDTRGVEKLTVRQPKMHMHTHCDGIMNDVNALYALLLEIVCASHTYNKRITCSEKILSTQMSSLGDYMRFGRDVLAWEIRHVSSLSLASVAIKVLCLRPMLQQAVIDMLICETQQYNMGILMWMSGGTKDENQYEHVIDTWPVFGGGAGVGVSGSVIGDAPIIPLLSTSVERIVRYYIQKDRPVLTHDEYRDIRQLVAIVAPICALYHADANTRAVISKFARINTCDLEKFASQYGEAWNTIFVMFREMCVPTHSLTPLRIYSTVRTMESAALGRVFESFFFVRYSDALVCAFREDSREAHVGARGVDIQPSPWPGVECMRVSLENVRMAVHNEKYPDVTMIPGVGILDDCLLVVSFLRDIADDSHKPRFYPQMTRDESCKAFDTISIALEHFTLYWPDIEEGQLRKALSDGSKFPNVAAAVVDAVYATRPLFTTAVLFSRGSSSRDTPPTPVESYEHGSAFDTFIHNSV